MVALARRPATQRQRPSSFVGSYESLGHDPVDWDRTIRRPKGQHVHRYQTGAISIKKTVLLTLGVVLLVGGVYVSKLVWGKPFNIDHFFNRVFIEYAMEDPELLTQLRILEPMGLTFHNDDLTDASIEHHLELAEMARENLEMLRSYDRSKLDGQQQVSYDILEYFLQDAVDGERFLFHGYPVDQMGGVHQNLPDFMSETHQIDDVEGAEDYITRLSKFPTKFDQVLEDLAHREKLGIIPPRFVVDHNITFLREFRDTPPRENVLYTSFVERTAEVEDLDDERRTTMANEVERQIVEAVYPSYEKMLAYFEALQPTTTTDDGVWKLPDGEAFYNYRLRSTTTTSMTADEIHTLGLSEVDRIQAEMTTILAAEGYEVESVGATMTALLDEERFFYPDTDEGREQILADYQGMIDEITAGMDQAFDFLPRAGVEVKRVPEFKEATETGAYYTPPPRDYSRPGVFWANLRDVREIPKFGMRTLTYHEATPGHHFQIAAQQELEGLPIFRTIPLFTAYVEGWALYAENLAKDLGYQEDPYDDLGRLQAELFRAVRLVVDTGIHAKRWTREQALEYMIENTGMVEGEVVTEIERYIVWPGQATAYKVGMLKILELREKARNALGPDFDLAEFHNVVLKNGAVPLDLLERLVDAYIQREGGESILG